jgi:hypothetical protein
VGVLAGLAFALFKIVQARRPSPAFPGDEDPWAPARAREPEPVEPPLVKPAFLESPAIRERATSSAQAQPAPFDQGATAPPLRPPAEASPPPEPTVAEAPALEPDDDEVVILSPTDEVAPAPTPAKKARAAKAAAKKAGAKKAAAKKAAEKAGAEKAGAEKAGAKKAGAKKAGAKKAAKKAGAGKAVSKKAGGGTAAKKAAADGAPTTAWVEPEGPVCPPSHPVKAKLRSGIFHLPGMAAYRRTTPDRCYPDEAAAEGDGLRKAAR